jgi:hypothetical protein
MEEHAREFMGLPKEWTAYGWECYPTAGRKETTAYLVTGACFQGKTTEGKPDIRIAEVEGTVATVALPKAVHKRWLADRETRTGKCSGCDGSGREVALWSSSTGTTYRPCSDCGGTGKPKAKK